MALVTAAQVRELLPQVRDETAIDAAIARAEAVLAAWLFFRPSDAGEYVLEDATYTEFVEPQQVRGRELHLRMRPVIAITSIHQSVDETYDTDDLVDPSEYELQPEEGWVLSRRAASFGGWSRGYRALRAIYVAGLGTPGNGPQDVQLAVAWQTQQILRGSWKLRQPEDDPIHQDAFDPRIGELLGHRRLWEFAIG
ncbi:MAG: hypothetical protein AAF211_12770 [Myxococcota bacterium]